MSDSKLQYAVGEFGFPIEGPEWEKACDESEAQLEALIDKIKSGAPFPAPSAEMSVMLDRILSQRQLTAAGKESDSISRGEE